MEDPSEYHGHLTPIRCRCNFPISQYSSYFEDLVNTYKLSNEEAFQKIEEDLRKTKGDRFKLTDCCRDTLFNPAIYIKSFRPDPDVVKGLKKPSTDPNWKPPSPSIICECGSNIKELRKKYGYLLTDSKTGQPTGLSLNEYIRAIEAGEKIKLSTCCMEILPPREYFPKSRELRGPLRSRTEDLGHGFIVDVLPVRRFNLTPYAKLTKKPTAEEKLQIRLEGRPFTLQDMKLFRNNPKLPYKENPGILHVVDWAQRKFVIMEMYFLTKYFVANNSIIIYIGLDCSHLKFLSSLFPSIKIHAFLTSPKVVTSGNLKVIRKLPNPDGSDFTSIRSSSGNDSKTKVRIGLICNHRTFPPEVVKNDMKIREQMAWKDLEAQIKWVKSLDPDESFLRFRLPYPIKGLPEKYNYYEGDLYLQPWNVANSTECRLIPKKPYNLGYLYDAVRIEQQMFYHNVKVRTDLRKYRNPFIGTEEERISYIPGLFGDVSTLNRSTGSVRRKEENHPVDPPELLNDYDSTYEAIVLREYLTAFFPDKFNTKESIEKEVILSSRKITKSLGDSKGAGDGEISKMRKTGTVFTTDSADSSEDSMTKPLDLPTLKELPPLDLPEEFLAQLKIKPTVTPTVNISKATALSISEITPTPKAQPLLFSPTPSTSIPPPSLFSPTPSTSIPPPPTFSPAPSVTPILNKPFSIPPPPTFSGFSMPTPPKF